LSSAVPNRSAFVEKMEAYDPTGTFLNKFGKRIQGVSDAVDKDPAVTHCALQDYCVCGTSADCAAFQTCKHFNQFSVCKDLSPLIPIPAPKFNFGDLTNFIGLLNSVFNLIPNIL